MGNKFIPVGTDLKKTVVQCILIKICTNRHLINVVKNLQGICLDVKKNKQKPGIKLSLRTNFVK